MQRSPIVLLMCALLAHAAARAQAPAKYDVPLGIAMEAYPYPFPVRFLDLDVEGEPARMAYMDVPPAPRQGSAEAASVVLLLHGKNFYGSYWKTTADALTAAGFRVVVPDQIGFGKSSKPDVRYSFDLLAAHTAALLDHLKVDRAAIVGHSMGGMLAVRFARNHPQRTTHLVLENPIGLEDYRFAVPPQPIEALVAQEMKNADPEKLRAFLKRYFVRWDEAYETFVEVRARVAHSGEYPRFAKASALTYEMIHQQPVRHEFHLLSVPTLLVIGQEDRTTLGRGIVAEQVLKTLGNYPELGRGAAKDIPGAKLIELDNVGHIPHLEAPERFHPALVEFLTGAAK